MAAKEKNIKFLELSIVAAIKSRSSLITRICRAKLKALSCHCISLKCLIRWKTLDKYFSLNWCRFPVTVASSGFYHLGKAPTYLHLKEASVYVQFLVILFALHCLLGFTSSAQGEYCVEKNPLGRTLCTSDCMVTVHSLKLLQKNTQLLWCFKINEWCRNVSVILSEVFLVIRCPTFFPSENMWFSFSCSGLSNTTRSCPASVKRKEIKT